MTLSEQIEEAGRKLSGGGGSSFNTSLKKVDKELHQAKKDAEKRKKLTDKYSKDNGELDREQIDKLIAKAYNQYRKQLEYVDTVYADGTVAIDYDKSDIDKQVKDLRDFMDKHKKFTRVRGVKALEAIDNLQKMSRKSYYDQRTYVKFEAVDEERSTANAEVTKEEWMSLSKINAIRRKEAKGLDLKDNEFNALYAWNDANKVWNNYNNVVILETDEDVVEFLKNSRNKKLDFSIGGQSALLNDLFYSELTKGSYAKQIIDKIRSLMMADKYIYAKIEQWYQSPRGFDVRTQLNNATGENWYKNFKDAAAAILAMIDALEEEIGINPDDDLEDIKAKAEAALSGYMD